MAVVSALDEQLEQQEQDEFDLPTTIKVALLGAEGVGKTTFLYSYMNEMYPVDPELAIDQTLTKSEKIDGDEITIKLTEFQHKTIGPNYFTSSTGEDLSEYDCFILMVVPLDVHSLTVANDFSDQMNKINFSDRTPKARSLVVFETMSINDPTGTANASEWGEVKQMYVGYQRDLWRHLKLSFIGDGSTVMDGMNGIEHEVMERVVLQYRERCAHVAELERMGDYKKEVEKSVVMDTCMSGEGTIIYDMLTVFVSLADVITDLWVLIQWYHQGRTAPFYISVTILALAQMSYIFAFSVRYDNDRIRYYFILPFLIILSPLLSLIMYFTSLGKGCIYEMMIGLGFEVDKKYISPNSTKIGRFLQDKMYKHMGFLLEAAVEAFPQSILQMAVMVYYSETNWVSVASILLSLISVCTKSLVFSYALELRTMIFNYLSIVLDFISVFVLISWIFFNPNGKGLTQLAWVWIYKFACTSAAGVYISGFIGWSVATYFAIEDGIDFCCGEWFDGILMGICYFLMYIVFSPFATLMVEVFCCSGIALLMFPIFTSKFSSSQAAGVYWSQTLSFVTEARTWEESKLRVIFVMESISKYKGNVRDHQLLNRLSESRQCMYEDVSWKDIRSNLDRKRDSSPLNQFLHAQRSLCKELCNMETKEDVLLGLLALFICYFAIPIHICTRVFNFFYVWIAISLTPFDQIDHLQLGMAVLLAVLQSMWLISLISICRFNYVTWHIYPGKTLRVDLRSANEAILKFKRVTDLYSAYKNEPERKQAVLDFFGDDVGSVVVQYLPTMLFDMGDEF